MKKIALSGVMGAGKSSVIAVLKEAGIPVFDCDEINAQLLRPKEAGHAALLERYGSRFIDAKGEIDRQALSDHMFETAEGRREVEAILHPLIKQRLQEEMAHCGSEIAVAEVPLLFECGWQDAFDETWVVAADEDILIARLKGRGVSEQEARRRLAVQMSQEEKIALCDVVLYNNADRESLKRQVLSCLERHRRADEQRGRMHDHPLPDALRAGSSGAQPAVWAADGP